MAAVPAQKTRDFPLPEGPDFHCFSKVLFLTPHLDSVLLGNQFFAWAESVRDSQISTCCTEPYLAFITCIWENSQPTSLNKVPTLLIFYNSWTRKVSVRLLNWFYSFWILHSFLPLRNQRRTVQGLFLFWYSFSCVVYWTVSSYRTESVSPIHLFRWLPARF